MKLGVVVPYGGRKITLPFDMVREAERLGYDSCWTSEAYGSDAISISAWLLAHTRKIKVGTAILQLPARAPTMAAMTAMSLNQLSGGRFIVGLGPSGPQVVEGWYGASYAKPLTRLHEYIDVMRQVFARETAVAYDGHHYQLPYRGADATGLGKPLKTILHHEQKIPIYTASLQPKAVALSAEIADGFFPIWLAPEKARLFAEPIQEGLTKAGGGKSLKDFDVAPFVAVAMGDDLQACRNALKPNMALYIGGMGARGKNFYTTYASQLGYADAATRVQDLYLAGQKDEAAALVPDALIDDVALVGSKDRIRDRLQAWISAGRQHLVGTMIVATSDMAALRLIAETVLEAT